MISICIIVKNNEDSLRECLKRLLPYKYEIIVVDTGSTDNTKAVALEFTDRVFEYEWCDDFSKARNFAISKSSCEYILMVDSDEYITDIKKKDLEELIRLYPQDVGRLERNNEFYAEGEFFIGKERINRLFNKNVHCYQGRIHEQVIAINGDDYNTYNIPVYMDHHGYRGSEQERNKKAQRNIRLLEISLQIDGEDPYTYYQLGKGYYMKKDYGTSILNFEKALEYDINAKLVYVHDLVETYGYALINAKQYKKALQLEGVYDDFKDSADFVFLMGLIYMNNALFDEAIQEFEKATQYNKCKIQGVNSYLAFYNIGVIKECLNDKRNALYYYNKCGEYEPSKQGILRCK